MMKIEDDWKRKREEITNHQEVKDGRENKSDALGRICLNSDLSIEKISASDFSLIH